MSMPRHTFTFTLEPLPDEFTAIYRRRGMKVPSASSSELSGALIPYEDREFHHAYATRLGLFWLPCVLCGKEFGGHEITDSVPDPTSQNQYQYITICPACTAERNGGVP